MTSKRKATYTFRPHLVRRKNGRYYIHHQHNGQQIRISTRTKIRGEAEHALDQYISDLAMGISPQEASTMTMHQGISNWLEDRQSPRNSLKACTLGGYRTFARKLLSAIPPGLLIRDFRREHVRRALDKLAQAGESSIQVAKCQTILSQVCNFLIIEGHLTKNPSVKVAPAAQYKPHKAMSEQEYQAILYTLEVEIQEAKPASRKAYMELRDLIALIWNTGFRFVEWTRIQWADVDFKKREATTRSPKNKGGTRTRRLTGSAIEVLQRRRQLCGKVFPGTYAGLMTAWQRFRARNPEFSEARFHGMRRAFVTRIHSEIGSLAAMTLAGHKSASMLDLYTDATQMDWGAQLDAM